MAEVVDSIIAELIVKNEAYVRGFNEATAAHERFLKSTTALKTNTFDLQAEGQKYKAGAAAIQQAEEQTTQVITRAKKTQSDAAKQASAAEKQAAKESAAAAKAAAKERADAAKAAAKAEADAVKQAAREMVAAEKAAAREVAAAQRAAAREGAAQDRRFYAQGPKIFEAKAREFSAADRLKDAEAAKVEAAAIREAAKAEAELTRTREAEAAVAARHAEREARLDANAASRIIQDGRTIPSRGAAGAATSAPAEAEVAKEAAAAERLAAAERRIKDAQTAIGRAGGTVALERGESITLTSNGGRRNDPEALAAAERELAEARAERDRITAEIEAARRAPPPAPAPRSVESDRATAARQTEIMSRTRVPADTENAAAEAEVDRLKRDEIIEQSRIAALAGEEKREQQEIAAALRLERQLRAQNVSEAEILVALDQQAAAFEARRVRLAEERAIAERRRGRREIEQFARGAGFSSALGGPGAIAGIAAAAGVGIGVEAIKAATDYADALDKVSKQAGISAEALQVYHRAAVDNGSSADDFDKALAHLTDQLAKARSGSADAQKVFTALGVSIKGNETAGQLLPTLIDRLTGVSDKSLRAAAELQAFGSTGEKLDGLLAGGNQKVNELAKALEDTGKILSSADIAKLEDVSNKLADVKAQLQVDVAQTVANNADAIKSLADAFAGLVDKIGDAITAYDRFHNSPIGKAISAINEYDPTQAAARAIGRYIDSKPTVATQVGQSGNSVNIDLGSDVQGGKPNNRLLKTLNAPKGPRGKSADQLQNEAEQRTKQFNDRMAGLDQRQLRAREEQTGDIQKQAAIENALGQRALQREIDDIESTRKQNLTRKGVDAALENRRAAELKSAAVKTEQAESDAREQDVAARFSQQQERIYEDKIATDREGLDARQSLARTDKDRLALALQQLAKEKEAERSSLQNEIDTAKPGTDVWAQRYRLANLDQTYADRATSLQRQNAGPLGSYLDSLPRTADEVNEAFQRAEVDGIQGFNSELGKTISGFLKLHGAAGQFLDDIVQIGIKWAEAQLFGGGPTGGQGGGFGSLIGGLGKLLGIGGSAGGGGGLSALIGGATPTSIGVSSIDSSLLTIPGLAGGGSIDIMGRGGIDKNLLSLNGQPVARVNMGERINVVNPNMRATGGQPQVTVLAPRHYDLSNAVIDRDTLAAMNAENRAYADAVSRVAYGRAVDTANGSAPGAVRRTQTLKG